MVLNIKSGFLLFILVLCSIILPAQNKRLSGVVKDKQSDEPIPFASVVFKLSKKGVLTDSAGRFSVDFDGVKNTDSITVQSVGYKILTLPVSSFKDSNAVATFKIEVLPPSGEAIVKSKYNRALWFWKKIMANKEKNNRTRWDNYSYEIYNKIEMDLNNVKKEKLQKNLITKPLSFVLSYVDTSEEHVATCSSEVST